MKEIAPPPSIIHNELETVRELFAKHVIPTYGRFDIALSHGAGSHVWDVSGRRYLDLGGGIAVCALGHANPEISQALIAQSQRLVHVSNLYYNEPQGRLAQQITRHLAGGKVFFCNSGAEANEGLYKLARKYGHEEGRFEILTAHNSFHGRTLAGISATAQEKVKKGFEPLVEGFRHVPFNDIEALENAISPATIAMLIEGIQGEGGITPATPDYLLRLRRLCDDKKLLLMMDGVQCGHFRSGRFQSFQRILENDPNASGFQPDAISMAKSLGGGFPMGAFWVRGPHADLLGPGSHATTFGGNPLACAVALKVFEVIERDRLDQNARVLGDWIKSELESLARLHPAVLKSARGMGLMLGLELRDREQAPGFAGEETSPALQFVNKLHEKGVLTVPSGNQIVRLLPPLNLTRHHAEEGLDIIAKTIQGFDV